MEIALFLTYGNGLTTWAATGILERELALYAAHAEAGVSTTVVSYAGPEDLEIARQFPFLRVLCNLRVLHLRAYAWIIPVVHAKALRTADIFRTNQLYGAHVAARAVALQRKPFVVRQGYGHYEHRVQESGQSSAVARRALHYERRYLRRCDMALFTTPGLAERAVERHDLDPRRSHVIANYVVEDVWTPPYDIRAVSPEAHFVFFGRFTAQKNLEVLLHAMAGIAACLTLIGEGPGESDLRRLAAELGVSCRFPGRLPQSEIRGYLMSASAFVLPSHYEGHPKSLIEAMCLGMPIVAAASPGISEVLRDGETAWLGPPTMQGFRAVLAGFLAAPAQERARRGCAARRDALALYSVQAAARRERDLYRGAGWLDGAG